MNKLIEQLISNSTEQLITELIKRLIINLTIDS